MSDLFKDINARTKLAGTNKLEILMFSLGMDNRTGRRETYGINVFKVREVMRRLLPRRQICRLQSRVW
jgi:two-component system chemotaxis response regulator CheV